MLNFEIKTENMSPEQVREYLTNIVTNGPTPGMDGLESTVEHNFILQSQAVNNHSEMISQLEKQLAKMQAQLNTTRAMLESAAGEMAGYAKLLASAEDARRQPPKVHKVTDSVAADPANNARIDETAPNADEVITSPGVHTIRRSFKDASDSSS